MSVSEMIAQLGGHFAVGPIITRLLQALIDKGVLTTEEVFDMLQASATWRR